MHKYMQVLRTKAGELAALSKLTDSEKAPLLPLLDVPRVDKDWERNRPKKSLDAHLIDTASRIGRAWGTTRPIVVDLYDLDLAERTTTGEHPVGFFADRLREVGIDFVPTIGLDRDAEFNAAVKEVVARDRKGACVRLLIEDIELGHQLPKRISDLMREIGVKARDVKLLLDLRSLLSKNLDNLEELILECIEQLEPLVRWESVCLAGSGVPRLASDVLGPGKSGYFPRLELELWKRVDRQLSSSLLYGDYGTVHPDLVDEDPRKLARNMGPNIKYTLNDKWLVIRGHSFRKHPLRYGQYHSMAKELVESDDFFGAEFSFGDRYVWEKARKQDRPGNQTTWITMSTSHHLAQVRAQFEERKVRRLRA